VLEDGQDVVVVVPGAHVDDERRPAAEPERGRGEERAFEAVGLPLAHDPSRGGRAGPGVVGDGVQPVLDVDGRVERRQEGALVGIPGAPGLRHGHISLRSIRPTGPVTDQPRLSLREARAAQRREATKQPPLRKERTLDREEGIASLRSQRHRVPFASGDARNARRAKRGGDMLQRAAWGPGSREPAVGAPLKKGTQNAVQRFPERHRGSVSPFSEGRSAPPAGRFISSPSTT